MSYTNNVQNIGGNMDVDKTVDKFYFGGLSLISVLSVIVMLAFDYWIFTTGIHLVWKIIVVVCSPFVASIMIVLGGFIWMTMVMLTACCCSSKYRASINTKSDDN